VVASGSLLRLRRADDCCATVEDLRKKGVDIMQEPAERPYGVEDMIRDDCGNWIVLVEAKPYAGG